MPSKPVILNNTPLIALHFLQAFPLLEKLYGQVWIPTIVQQEFLAFDTDSRRFALLNAPWIKVAEAQVNPTLQRAKLDTGELAVLALAVEYQARLVVIDELRARKYAERLGLPLTGTLGVLLAGKKKGYLSAITPLLARLQASGMYLDERLVLYVRHMAGEL